MTFPQEIVIATRNPGKLREMTAGLVLPGGPPICLRSLADFPDAPDVEETGSTYLENARMKAESAFRATGIPSLADDTGLEVDVLDGAPGLHSGRYAGLDQHAGRNVARLLTMLDGVPDEKRTARFRCVLVFCEPEITVVEGVVEGRILGEAWGTEGFGYDPVFLVDETGKTMAELNLEEKNRLSHRGKALQALREKLTVERN